MKNPNKNGSKKFASNPVAPTTNLQALRKIVQNAPVAQPVAPVEHQVWNALAEIGRQLQILASANGSGVFRAAASPPPIVATPALTDTLSLVELINEFLITKTRSGRSDRYLRALRNSLKKFSYGRSQTPVNAITLAEVETWLHSSQWEPKTQHGYLGDVRTLFNFALRRGYLLKNPALGVELPEIVRAAATIHTPELAAAVLEFARRYDLNICRSLAVRYFAGLRSIEAERTDESLIRAEFIEVTVLTAKGARARRRRVVDIQPNLKAWLALGGELPVKGNKSNVWRDFNAALFKATGIEWAHNVTRHSFCSYHLAKFQNAGATALQAGHTEQMLFSNYREVVTKADGEKYFNIYPA